jgi:DNA-directed RNA polymerase subunit RPC12/RpoP
MASMARTLCLPDALDGAMLTTQLVAESQAFGASAPIASFDVEGRHQVLMSDADGALLRWLMKPGSLCAGGVPIAILGAPRESIGYEPAWVQCVRVLILRRCEECGSEYPINGIVERVRCTRCGESQRLTTGFWRDYVAEHVRAARTPCEASGANVVAGKHGASNVRCWGVPPLCRKCLSLIEWNALNEAWQRAQQQRTVQVFCGECGEAHRARQPPAWASTIFPGLAFALGETAEEAGSAEPVKPVIFKCPSCLAALKIDGIKRIVRCSYCESDVYLPDDLWLYFNPAARRARWWMLFRP